MSHTHTAIEFWKEFLHMYRSMPELWLVRSKLYRDRRLKVESYGRLLALMRMSDSHANIHTLKRKINNFRTSYRRELRKVLDSDNTYTPSLWYFKELDFLYELETGELQLEHSVAAEQDRDLKVLQHEANISVAFEAHLAESEESLCFMQQRENGVETDNDNEQVHPLDAEDVDMISETFQNEEDVLRLDAVVDGDVEPEAEHDHEPETENLGPEVEHHVDDYRGDISLAGSIKNNAYQSGSSHLRLNAESLALDKSGRRIRIRRRRSSNDSEYGETARKRRNEETTNRDRERDRDRDREIGDRERTRERDRELDSESEHECELIGRRMATHFRHMRPDQRLYAERIISEVLVYGRMNRLSFEAQFILGQK
ncbi:uncharacterized protein LOC122624662 isoform X1 [Drosophila teissieri]|uniref:uncharacterized protein LOC122624662 isoform X1 n=1 Tax=Drosophila teissieri TaxID=7243 RepID=UPI001CBA0488|nr:uncharacterized protein LOC122624662 isoform X1 [Drosophila teissieri]